MNKKLTISVLLMAALSFGLPMKAQTASVPNPSYTGKGNPILPDFHADGKTRKMRYTAEYYAYKHFSHFVTKGTEMIAYAGRDYSKTKAHSFNTYII